MRGEASTELRKLPEGPNVWIYRTKEKKWCGPYTFIKNEGVEETVQTPKGRRLLISTCVKQIEESKLIDVKNAVDYDVATEAYATATPRNTKTRKKSVNE